jgi:NAD(P)-dependent dehydrogenase (short-subunit alcohol dehydrogenase family)
LLYSATALQGRHILITGATGGIGEKVAKLSAACGADVSITGRNQEKLEALYKKLTKITDKDKLHYFRADIGKEEQRIDLIERAEAELGVITGLVNAAGVAENIPLASLNEKTLEKIMHTNHTSTILLTKLVYKKMKEKQLGSIVNVASLSGLRGTYGGVAYASSKFALIGFTQSLALEAIQSNINVNAVCPGYVHTQMAKQLIKKKATDSGRTYEEQLSLIESGIPSGRITSPEEVANTIIFLLLNSSGNIVGESIKISGGAVL